jgi:ribonuclease HI
MAESSNPIPVIIAYTDGSSLGNPGPGGYGVVLALGSYRKELSGGFRLTTNNRMELLAAIVALEALTSNRYPIRIYTDSEYVRNAVEKRWVFGWEKKGFLGKKNADLWRRFLRSYRQHRVSLVWVKGHAGIPENERCDQLAKAAARQPRLPIDEGFESQAQPLAD